MRPRARILVVDGTDWPTSSNRLLNRLLPGQRVDVRGAVDPLILQSGTLELLIESAAIDDATLIRRGRGVDCVLVIEGPYLARRIDALAIVSVLGERPLIVALCARDKEPALREVMHAAGLDADAALMLDAHNRAGESTTARLLDVLDAHLSRPRRATLRIVAEEIGAVLVSGETPVSAKAWALADDGYWPEHFVYASPSRAGDVLSLPRPSWRAVHGVLDDSAHHGANHSERDAPPCIGGRVVLDSDAAMPPRGAEVVAFTAGGESEGFVDESGALVLRRALPLQHGARIGVLVVKTGMRPSTPGPLAARVIACAPHETRASLRRRPSRPNDAELLYALHAQTMRAYVEATWGAWDDAAQRERFFAKGGEAGRFQLLVDVTTNDVVAAYRVQRQLHELVLASIEVAPAWQRRGIGSEIVQGLVGEAERGYARMTLAVLRANDRARDLYDRLGFESVGSSATHFHLAMIPRTRS